MTRRRRRSRLLGAALLLLLVELALQLAGPLVQQAMSRRDRAPDPDAPLTILCVGDSNTYGLHLPRLYAYPALLRAAVGRRYRRAVNVVNRGIPGQNSAQVAAGLTHDLAEVSPDIVLLLAGINDTWNTDGQESGLASWLGQLKLVRLFRVLTAGVTSTSTFQVSTDAQGEIVVDRGAGARRVNQGDSADADGLAGAALERVVNAGLERAIALCREAGSQPVLLTYAENAGPFAEVNALIREVAAEQQLLLIDLARAFAGHFAESGHTQLMFDDHHPNARGYRQMALDVDAALAAASLLPPILPAAQRSRAAPPPLDRPPRLTLSPDGGLLLAGPPGWGYQLLLACAPEQGHGFDANGFAVPLSTGPILALSRLEPSFSGRFDASGQSTVAIPRALRASASCPLAACLLLLRDDADSLLADDATSVAAVSQPLSLP